MVACLLPGEREETLKAVVDVGAHVEALAQSLCPFPSHGLHDMLEGFAWIPSSQHCALQTMMHFAAVACDAR